MPKKLIRRPCRICDGTGWITEPGATLQIRCNNPDCNNGVVLQEVDDLSSTLYDIAKSAQTTFPTVWTWSAANPKPIEPEKQ